MRDYLLCIGRGIGQVLFQNNALSGLIMLIGIACNSWLLALLALAGTILSTATAQLSGYSKIDIQEGLYGFNGTLVGIAIGVYWEINGASLGLLVIGSAASTYIARLFRCQDKLPGFTAPFILSIWALLALSHGLFPGLLAVTSPAVPTDSPDFLQAFSLNIGQVMFQGGTLLSGLLFLLAIGINSRMNTLYTALGAALPLFTGLLITDKNYAAFNAGLFGYNAVLCSIALGNFHRNGFLAAILAIVISTSLQIWGMHEGFVTLTAPFVVGVWIVQGCNKIVSNKVVSNNLISYRL